MKKKIIASLIVFGVFLGVCFFALPFITMAALLTNRNHYPGTTSTSIASDVWLQEYL